MNIQDQIAADQAAVATAQAALDAANAQLATDQAKAAVIQPHLDLLDKIEGEFMQLEQDVADDVRAALDAVKASITPHLAEMRALFLG